ncbi:MAG: hypothetical protein VX834_11225 [Myxococcota bacterium]|nr:hypothetical protein [Myxococcota bacterium]
MLSLILSMSGFSTAWASDNSAPSTLEVDDGQVASNVVEEDEEVAESREPLVNEARVPAQPVDRPTSQPRVRGKMPTEAWGNDTVFAGHRFLSIPLQPSALLRSFFAFKQSASVLSIPAFPVRGDGSRFDVMTEGLDERLAFGFKVSELMAVDAFGNMNIEYGPDGPSLLFRGGIFRIGGGFGATFRVARFEKLQLALRPYVSVGNSQLYSVLPLVEGARELNETENVEEVLQSERGRQLLTYQSQRTLGAALLMAWALDPAFGVQSSLGGAWTRDDIEATQNDYVREETTNFMMLNASVSFEYDFWLRGLSMALNGEYELSYGRLTDHAFPSANSRLNHRLGAGVYYTGREDLQLGMSYYSVLGLAGVRGVPAQSPETAENLTSDPVTLNVLSFNVEYIW